MKLRVRGSAGDGYDYLGSLTLVRGDGGSLNGIEILFAGGQFKDGEVMYFEADHLGSVRAVINSDGETLATNNYMPFGSRHTGGMRDDNIRYKFNGKEEQTTGALNLLDYGARMYDPETGRWFVIDPLAEKYTAFSPYNYCLNNPMRFVDPTGMEVVDLDHTQIDDKLLGAALSGGGMGTTFGSFRPSTLGSEGGGGNSGPGHSYTYNEKSGDFKKGGSNDLGYDQVVSERSGKNGPRILINKIAKGILSDGLNLKYKDGVVNVGGPGQATLECMQDFLVRLTGLIKAEVAGYYLSPTGSINNISHVYVSKYDRNTEDMSYSTYSLHKVRPDIYGKVTPVTHFHTHPYWHPWTALQDRLEASPRDRRRKISNTDQGIQQHLIITKGDNGNIISHEF